MTKKSCSCFSVFAVFTVVVLLGCATPQTPATPTGSALTCIQGAVSYVNPVTSSTVPYSSATVTAWRHGKDQGLAETKADKDGRFCIEVPAGSNAVDLRVWGMEIFEGKNYVCEGSANHVDPGSMTGKCGSGNCLKVDIRVECRERVERRRGF